MIRFIILLILCINVTYANFPVKITDVQNVTIELKQKPKRIVVAGGMWPVPTILTLLDGPNNIVYMPTTTKNSIRYSFLADFYPALLDIKDGQSENIEELLALKPDLFIVHIGDIKILELMRKSGIPTIALDITSWNFDLGATVKGWLSILAPVVGAQEKATLINDYIADTLKRIEKLTQDKPKPKAIIIHSHKSDRILTVGGRFANYLFLKTNATNGVNSFALVDLSLEDLYQINPDIIYINNFNPLIPSDFYVNPLYSPLKAVTNKKVYKFPHASYRPFAPSLDLPILLLFLAQYNLNIDLNLKQETQKYYKEVFKLELTPLQLDKIFEPNGNRGKL